MAHGETSVVFLHSLPRTVHNPKKTVSLDRSQFSQSTLSSQSIMKLTCLFISGIMVVFAIDFSYFCGSRHFQRERGKGPIVCACVRTSNPVSQLGPASPSQRPKSFFTKKTLKKATSVPSRAHVGVQVAKKAKSPRCYTRGVICCKSE